MTAGNASGVNDGAAALVLMSERALKERRATPLARISGYAVAGGLELALWCDLRVAARDAVFGVFCRRWGVPLIDGGTVRLARPDESRNAHQTVALLEAIEEFRFDALIGATLAVQFLTLFLPGVS